MSIKIRKKARAAWEQEQAEEAAHQAELDRRNDERLRAWLADNFDGITPEDFERANIRMQLGIVYGKRAMSLMLKCPRCGQDVKSQGVTSWVGLGRMLESPKVGYEHNCPAKWEGKQSPGDRLLDTLLEVLQIEG